MQVLLTVHQFFPEFRAGTEVLTLGVARELVARGHRVAVLAGHRSTASLQDGERFDAIEHEGITVYRFHHAYAPMGGQTSIAEIEYDNRLAARHFAGLVAKLAPDVVHFFHFARLGAGLVDVAVEAGIPAWYTPTDFWAVCPRQQLMWPDGRICSGPSAAAGNCARHVAMDRGSAVMAAVARRVPDAMADVAMRAAGRPALQQRPLARELAALGRRRSFIRERLNRLQGILAPTTLMRDVLLRHGVDAARIAHLPFGIESSGIVGVPRKRPARGPLSVGFIGTLLPHKGCHVLLEAFRSLGRDRARLAIYGDPSISPDYGDRLRALAAGLPVEFRGTFPNERIGEVLASIDVLVVPSIWQENAPLVLHSAMAAQCPAVVSDYPGMTEVVHDGIDGRVVRPGDAGALAAALRDLLDRPEVLERLSANCRRPKDMRQYVSELLEGYDVVPSGPGSAHRAHGRADALHAGDGLVARLP